LRGAVLKHHQQKTCFLLSIEESIFWAANHSAVHVSMGEADELAALHLAVFAEAFHPCVLN